MTDTPKLDQHQLTHTNDHLTRRVAAIHSALELLNRQVLLRVMADGGLIEDKVMALQANQLPSVDILAASADKVMTDLSESLRACGVLGIKIDPSFLGEDVFTRPEVEAEKEDTLPDETVEGDSE